MKYYTIADRSIRHAMSRLLHRYADWRIGATPLEKRCYKQSESILLTFDDYGTEDELRETLRILKEKQVRAMFFIQGDWAEAHTELVTDVQKAGHIVGNHTRTHKVLRGSAKTEIRAEIAGGLASPWLRPPEGRYNAAIRKIANSMGYAICYWTIDSDDWTSASTATMQHTILSELHPGAVILFHLHGKHTRELLPDLIDDIRGRGYQLTDFSEQWSPTAYL